MRVGLTWLTDMHRPGSSPGNQGTWPIGQVPKAPKTNASDGPESRSGSLRAIFPETTGPRNRGTSDERIQVNAAGQAELRLETPWRDGTTQRVLSPLEFTQRAARSLFNPLACRLQRVSRAPGR